MTTKTEIATAELLRHDVKNRGHAFVILKEAGLSGSGAVFNKSVAEYEKQKGVKLGKSEFRNRAETNGKLRAQAFQMSAAAVKEHIDEIDEPDSLFWACWNVFRYEGKWSRQLKTSDFAVHFNS